jgi:hypothetical protein
VPRLSNLDVVILSCTFPPKELLCHPYPPESYEDNVHGAVSYTEKCFFRCDPFLGIIIFQRRFITTV